ncbi:sigma 54-interacting transcriptional regulator, partial [Gammaproteobacteria bacterium]|nr:sigma 54-interacting transcriptional regulator [Gammaproteobacteria bacterium]
ADLNAEEDGVPGPIGTVLGTGDFQSAILLCNYAKQRSNQYEKYLKKRAPKAKVSIRPQPHLKDPTNYSMLWRISDELLSSVFASEVEREVYLYVTPGTPAMAATLIMLAKSQYTSSILIQSNRDYSGYSNIRVPRTISESEKNVAQIVSAQVSTAADRADDHSAFGKILGESPAMVEARAMATRTALFAYPVLLLGESGTGKELFAQAVHSISGRAKKPFEAINCGAIPEDLIESELFGHEKGAFTGAIREKKGIFERANGGTVFLDELGEMPLAQQRRLLRVLQEKKILRVGGEKEINVDFRLVCATHQNLFKLVEKKEFRLDLYYRIAVIKIDLPALKDRGDDLEILSAFLLEKINKESKKNDVDYVEKKLSKKAMGALLDYHWPGNVRELESVLASCAVWVQGATIDRHDIEKNCFSEGLENVENGFGLDVAAIENFPKFCESLEKEKILSLKSQKLTKKEASAKLGYRNDNQTLTQKLKKYEIEGWK